MDKSTELLAQLTPQSELGTIIATYKETLRIIKTYEAVKDKARDLVKAYIERTGEISGRTSAGMFGVTKPTPMFQVNEEKWQAACAADVKLAAIQKQFEAAQRALDEAQREFLEDATPEPSIYIR
jgi:hypothetical protein